MQPRARFRFRWPGMKIDDRGHDAKSAYREDIVNFNPRRLVPSESPGSPATMQDGGRTMSGGRGKPGLTRIKALGRMRHCTTCTCTGF